MIQSKLGISNILVYTTLYPDHLHPNKCIFVHQRMKNVAAMAHCNVKVAAPIPYCPPWPALGKRYSFSRIEKKEFIDGVDVYHPRYLLVPKISMVLHGLLLAVGTCAFMKKLYRGYRFDLIDAHYVYPDGFAAVLLGKLFKVPVAITARGTDIHSFSELPSIKPLIQWTLSRCAVLISVSTALKNKMVQLGAPAEKIHTIPNGVALELFRIMTARDAKARLGLDPGRRIILAVGALTPNKGFHHIIRAMPLVLERFPDALLYIIGKGTYRRELASGIGDLGLNGKVFLVGEIDNPGLVYWYNAADVFCSASRREGLPNVIMEALACGTPVIATNVWGAPEIITSPEIGRLVDRNPRAIAYGIVTALAGRWDKNAIREHVAQRPWSVVAAQVCQVFESVMHGAEIGSYKYRRPKHSKQA